MTCNECAWIKGYEKTSFFGHRYCDYECNCLCHVLEPEKNGKSKHSNKIKNLLAEAIRRRDAELLEKVEGKKKYLKNLASGEVLPINGEYNRAIDDIIKLIKGE